MRPTQFLATVLAVASITSAWPWPESLGELKAVQNIDAMLHRRQNRQTATQTAEPTAEETAAESTAESAAASETLEASASASASASGSEAAPTTDEAAATSGSSDSSDSPDSTATETGTRRATTTTGPVRSGTRTSGNNTSQSTEFDPRLPAGGISMITPAAISGAQYYKIGEYVTFAWNYTSLEVTPTAIDILASCSANQATYTLATNQTVEETGRVIWDTKNTDDEEALLTSTYSLIIYDAESEISAAPAAGYLAPFRQFTFGMYQPQKYTPLAEHKCATCLKNGAMGSMERQALAVVGGVGIITVLSFTWFAGALGVF